MHVANYIGDASFAISGTVTAGKKGQAFGYCAFVGSVSLSMYTVQNKSTYKTQYILVVCLYFLFFWFEIFTIYTDDIKL